jgi:hypothetical protein
MSLTKILITEDIKNTAAEMQNNLYFFKETTYRMQVLASILNKPNQKYGAESHL